MTWFFMVGTVAAGTEVVAGFQALEMDVKDSEPSAWRGFMTVGRPRTFRGSQEELTL